MTTRACLVGMTLLGFAACARAEPAATEAMVQAHVAAATQAAGSDLTAFLALCKPAPATRPKGDDAGLAALINQPAPPPGKAFDNLYYVGAQWVSAWAIDTPDGIILIDALNNGKEAAQLIEGGMQRVGLDPARIKYIIVTHGHGDHYGGVSYLVGRYHPKVVASEQDWKMMETGLEFESRLWDAPPTRDVAVKDGATITLGGTTVTLYVTPGHTLGTISPVFEGRSGGQAHRVLEWGGTGFNFGADMPRLDAYIASTERMRKLAAEQKIDVLISNHSAFDEAPAKLAALSKAPSGPNPFVLGAPSVERALTVVDECAQAQRDRFRMMN
jgi:metallo-beta-lactamase class B